jgi:putative transposase
MKKRFTEEQIIGFLREAESGLAVAELCRRHDFSEANYYRQLAGQTAMVGA